MGAAYDPRREGTPKARRAAETPPVAADPDAAPDPDTPHEEVAGEGSLYSRAALFDVLYSPDTALEVRGLERIAARCGAALRRGARVADEPPLWLEVACGSGRYLRVLARRGYACAGFDLNERMLEYARARVTPKEHSAATTRSSPARRGTAPAADRLTLFRADMASFARPFLRACAGRRADFAFTTHNTIRHLQSDRAMLAHLDDMARCLRPGGLYAVGLGLASYGAEGPTEDVWEVTRGGLHVQAVAQNIPPTAARGPAARRELIMTHLRVETRARARTARGGAPGGARPTRPRRTVSHLDFAYRLRTYDRAEWEALLARSAMELIGACDERGDDAAITEPGYCLFLLRAR
jgi:SAM-dependent methyltransferase